MLRPIGFCLAPYSRRRARRRRMATYAFLALLALLLVLPAYLVYYPPHFLIRYFAHRWPDVLFHVPLPPAAASSAKLIALSIDDAPSGHTRDILAELAAHDAHATFFVVGGQVEGREMVLEDLVRAGNELGNHGMRDEPARALTLPELERQIGVVGRIIDDVYARVDGKAVQPKYYRPGSGFFSTAMRDLVANKLGYRMVLGGIYPHDPQVPYAWLNARHILGMARPGGIIICHDRRSWTVPMLRKVLPELKRRGYKVVTVTELLAAAAG